MNKTKVKKVKKQDNRPVYKFTDINVEEGRLFATPKDFIKFKRSRLQKQDGNI